MNWHERWVSKGCAVGGWWGGVDREVSGGFPEIVVMGSKRRESNQSSQ